MLENEEQNNKKTTTTVAGGNVNPKTLSKSLQNLQSQPDDIKEIMGMHLARRGPKRKMKLLRYEEYHTLCGRGHSDDH
jgi:hypothetical protein